MIVTVPQCRNNAIWLAEGDGVYMVDGGGGGGGGGTVGSFRC